MLCLIAAEENIAKTIKINLSRMSAFQSWTFETCSDATKLDEWSNVDVLLLSRFLKGIDQVKLLSDVRSLFPTSHIVIVVGETTESCKAYIRAAKDHGLYNVVTGKLPGDRPYNISVALTRSKNPETDGYEEIDEEPAHVVSESTQGERIAIPGAGKPGIIVVSTANKGGVGKTTTAVAVSKALSSSGIPTVLVDIDLGAPDVTTFFNLKNVPGIEKLQSSKVTSSQVDRLLVPVEKNLFLLPGPMNGTFPRFSGDDLAIVIGYLRSKYPVVVCDAPPEPWTKKWLYGVFEMADIALAVCDQSSFSEEETVRYAPTLLAMGIRPEKIRIVVSRYSPTLHHPRIIEAKFNAGFKRTCKTLPKIGALIPDYGPKAVKSAYRSEIIGLDEPNSPWHNLSSEIASLAGYSYEARQKKETGISGIFGRFFGRGGR